MSKYKIVWCIGIVSITTALFLSPINIWADFFYESFENGSGEFPDDWTTSSWIPGADFQWEEDTGIGGSKCVSIDNDDTANDARWEREILLAGNTWYNLFGWIKGENIIGGGAGANFCIMGTWDSTAGLGQNPDKIRGHRTKSGDTILIYLLFRPPRFLRHQDFPKFTF